MSTQFASVTLPARATTAQLRRSVRRTIAAPRAAVSTGPGTGGLDSVTLSRADGTSAQVYLFGGVVTSFKPKGGDDVLYIRPDAKFDKSKPVSVSAERLGEATPRLASRIARVLTVILIVR
jgi:glucose-6-phosphate 1-epimerase